MGLHMVSLTCGRLVMGLVEALRVLTDRLDCMDALGGGKMGLLMASRMRGVLFTTHMEDGHRVECHGHMTINRLHVM